MPAKRLDIETKQGESLKVSFQLYSDEAETMLLPFAGRVFTAELCPYNLGEDAEIILTEGHGLTAMALSSTITLEVPVEAAKFDIGLGHWYLTEIYELATSYPKSGKLIVGAP